MAALSGFKLRLGRETIEFTPLRLLVILAVILRIPSLFEPYWYGDEGIYLTLGEALRQGLVWYRDIHDNKPPLLYLLAAISGSVFWFRFLLLVWHAGTLVLFWKLTEKLFGAKPKAVIMTSTVFVVLTALPLLEANIANAEIFMIGTTVAAMLLLFWGKLTTKVIFSAGVLFSLSTLFKVPAVLDLAALVAFWGISSFGNFKRIKEVVKQSLVLGLGFATPILLTFIYFRSQNALPQYISAAFAQNVGYVAWWNAPTFPLLGNQIPVGLTSRVVILAGVLLFILLFKKRFDLSTLFAVIWLSFTLFALLLSGRPYPHYLIQAVPPLAILVALVATQREKYRFLPIPFLLIFLGSLVFYKFYYYATFSYYQNFLAWVSGLQSQEAYFRYFGSRVPRNYQLAQTLAARTRAGEPVFIWGTEPEIYALARRLPPGRFVTAYHVADYGGQGETLTALRQKNPKYIVVIGQEKTSFPGFFEFLQAYYLRIQVLDGAELWKKTSSRMLKNLKL